jgi:hypothetical protein
MANFDDFERLLKSVLGGELSIQDGARKISELPESLKVRAVKQKSSSDLENFLTRAKTALDAYFPRGPKFSWSENNQLGKDLYENRTRTQIELKSGDLMTDGNPGLKSVAWALENPIVTSVMKSGMTTRRELLLAGAPQSQIEASKSETMDLLFHAFSEVPLGKAPPKLEHFFRCMALGLTKYGEITSSFDASEIGRTPLLLKADWEHGLVLYEKAYLPHEPIDIVTIERTQRTQLLVRGMISGRIGTLYPNFKNSWTSRDGVRFEAHNWVATACFHVWIS